MKRFRSYVVLLTVILALLGANCTADPTAEAPDADEESASPTTSAPEESASSSEEGERLVLATTTSTDDSGLLSYILPDFEEQYGVTVDVVAVGTGQALQLGEDGNADVLLVHDRSREDAFMEAGHGVRREDVMYNDFVIVGPADDPADVRSQTSVAEAFAQIEANEAPFISRGDDSGTHGRELAIWSEAGIEPAGDWYNPAGQGMGAVLNIAEEEQAYTLSDRATFLARTLEGLTLEIVYENDPLLLNPYGVIAVNPEKSSEINNELANTFIDWLISVPTQELISEFGVDEFGTALFTPDSEPWRANAGE